MVEINIVLCISTLFIQMRKLHFQTVVTQHPPNMLSGKSRASSYLELGRACDIATTETSKCSYEGIGCNYVKCFH